MIPRPFRRTSRTLRRWLKARQPQLLKAAAFVVATIVGAAATVVVPDVIEWLRSDPAYRVSVERNPDLIQFETTSAGGSYVVDGPIDRISAPPADADTCVGRFDWAQGYGAVLADTAFIRVRVDANGDEPVYITGVSVVIDDSRPPLNGIHLACPGRGGQIDDRLVDADLSTDPPTVTISQGEGSPSEDVHYVVLKGEPEAFLVSAQTPTCYCLWHLELRVEVGGRTSVEVVDDSGEPFRTTSSSEATSFRWIEGRWTELTPSGPPVSPS